jgi:hypothetical protein
VSGVECPKLGEDHRAIVSSWRKVDFLGLVLLISQILLLQLELSGRQIETCFPGEVLLASAGFLGVSSRHPAFDQREVHVSQGTSAHFTWSANSSHEILDHKNHLSQWGGGSQAYAEVDGRSVCCRLHSLKQHQSLDSSSHR